MLKLCNRRGYIKEISLFVLQVLVLEVLQLVFKKWSVFGVKRLAFIVLKEVGEGGLSTLTKLAIEGASTGVTKIIYCTGEGLCDKNWQMDGFS